MNYLLLDGSALGAFLPERNWFVEYDFNLVDGEGNPVYERCRILRFAKAYWMTDRKGGLIEDAGIMFFRHHREEAA